MQEKKTKGETEGVATEMGGEGREEKKRRKQKEQWPWEMMKERGKTHFN